MSAPSYLTLVEPLSDSHAPTLRPHELEAIDAAAHERARQTLEPFETAYSVILRAYRSGPN